MRLPAGIKERTLQGVHRGEALVLGVVDGQEEIATVWDGILLLKRNRPGALVREWRGRLIVGGRFWREVPHAMVRNPRNLACYEDTLLSALTWPIRPWLAPGRAPERRLWRYLRRHALGRVVWADGRLRRG